MTGARYANDVWCIDDGFGPTRLGDEVARLALQADTPFTIGVVGKWGSGKTSVLRRAFATLGGRPIAQAVPLGEKPRDEASGEAWKAWHHRSRADAVPLDWDASLHDTADHSLCVWFSPWQHQQAENPLIPLLLEIRAQYTAWQQIKSTAKKLPRQGGLAALALVERVIDAAASLKLGRPARLAEGTTEAVRKAWREGTPNLDLSDGQRFHLAFEDAVEMLLGVEAGKKNGKQDARLIVFVDDLDRCEESTIVELLEAIKLYLSSRRCVFVLGVDDAAVLDALKRHWKGRPEDANREYLEKLFQATLPVPPPRPDGVAAWAQQACRAHGLPDDATLGAHIAELIEANPRKTKNFVNSLGILWAALRAHAPEANDQRTLFARRFLLFHYLRTQHREVWRLLEREPWALSLLAMVLTGADHGSVTLPEHVKPADQRLVEAVLFRAFAHVLAEPTVAGSPEDSLKRHGHLPIGEAVDFMLQRIDRKRSDECFKRLFRRWVIDQPLSELPPEFIHLPEPA